MPVVALFSSLPGLSGCDNGLPSIPSRKRTSDDSTDTPNELEVNTGSDSDWIPDKIRTVAGPSQQALDEV